MRFVVTLCFALLGFATSLSGQSEEPDPYSIAFVERAMKLHSQGIAVSIIEKNIPRRGDQLSIALLKILNDAQLSDPSTVGSLLPLIRQSFSEPQFISIEADKSPKVTLLLLTCLRQRISDAQTLREIQETVEFVKQKGH